MYELIVKKSRFLGYVKQIETAQQAKDFIADITTQNKKARHVCFAYVLDNAEKYSDAGEPSGTAGLPILSAIKRREIKNVCVVVVRYFGGILLGKGGLLRAYGKCAGKTLDTLQE
ncbi:MAG: YigZ family protein [Clostridiales bacterium]|jgi:uncharacterized YigZ family protein|nr:YigZ family protein [Clostridiales bacterium]